MYTRIHATIDKRRYKIRLVCINGIICCLFCIGENSAVKILFAKKMSMKKNAILGSVLGTT